MTTKTGIVKWYDAAKRYGFVVLDDDKTDVLLHASVLRDIDARFVLPGAIVEFEVQETERGLSVSKVLAVKVPEGNAVRRRRNSNGKEIPYTPCSPEAMVPARVKWYNPIKGYGFVNTTMSTADVFIHAETLRAAGLIDLQQGEHVRVLIETHEKGVRVTNIMYDTEKKSV